MKRTLRKHKRWNQWELVKLLFHGTTRTDPKEIYESEYGIDFRFSREGLYGKGTYFADNSNYSNQYAFHCTGQPNTRQMFMCFVCVGEFKSLA